MTDANRTYSCKDSEPILRMLCMSFADLKNEFLPGRDIWQLFFFCPSSFYRNGAELWQRLEAVPVPLTHLTAAVGVTTVSLMAAVVRALVTLQQ